MNNLIVIQFDSNDGDYCYNFEENKSEAWIQNLIRIWKILKNKFESYRVTMMYDNKCNPTHFISLDDELLALKLSEEDTNFFANILMNPYEHGVSLEEIKIYKYTKCETIKK